MPVEVRMPRTAGIAGEVAGSGRALRIDDAQSDPRFNPEVDRRTGFHTRHILCVPLLDREGRVFAVAQLLNRVDGQPFDDEDEKRFSGFGEAVSVILESWWRMAREQQDAAA